MAETENTDGRPVGLPQWMARKPSMNPRLIVVEGHASSQEIPVTLPMIIGREPTCGLCVSHPLVSRKHCKIYKRDEYLWVHDFGSANGTFIGEKRIRDSVLHPGDRLTVGPLTFVVLYQQAGMIGARALAKKYASEVAKGRVPAKEDGGSKVVPAVETDDDEPRGPRVVAPDGEAVPVAVPVTAEAQNQDDPEVDESESEDLESGDDEQIAMFFRWARELSKPKKGASTDSDSVERAMALDDDEPSMDDDASDVEQMLMDDQEQRRLESGPEDEASLTKLFKSISDQPDWLEAPIKITPAKNKEEAGVADLEAEGPDLVWSYYRQLRRQLRSHWESALHITETLQQIQQEQSGLIREELERLADVHLLMEQMLAQRGLVRALGDTEPPATSNIPADLQSKLQSLSGTLKQQREALRDEHGRRIKGFEEATATENEPEPTDDAAAE